MNNNDYEIVLKNKSIWEFYNEHKNVNIESVNLLLIEFMKTIFNHMTDDVNSNINSQLLSFMNENKNQIDTIKTSLSSISENVSKMNTDITNTVMLQFMNLKKDYIEDVKQIVTNNSLTTCEKISSLVDKNSNHLIDKTSLILNEVIPKNNDSVNRHIQENLKKFHSMISEDTVKLASSINQEKSLSEFIDNFESKYHSMMTTVQQPLYSFFSASEERITKNIDVLKESSLSSSFSQNKVLDELGDFLSKYKGSSNKGKFGENNLSSILNTIYPSAEVKDTTGTKASGDFIMTRTEKPNILFENKEYDHNINKEEVSKFIRDIDTQNTNGIFLSQYSGISFKNNFQIDIHKGNVLVYIQHCEYSADKIRIAVDIIDSLSNKLQDMNLGDESNTISKEILDDINQEYQGFITQKENMLMVLKDFQKKMTTQIEDIKLPGLDKYLSQKYAYVKSRIFSCDICNNFDCGSKQSLSAHQRGCKKKTSTKPVENVLTTMKKIV